MAIPGNKATSPQSRFITTRVKKVAKVGFDLILIVGLFFLPFIVSSSYPLIFRTQQILLFFAWGYGIILAGLVVWFIVKKVKASKISRNFLPIFFFVVVAMLSYSVSSYAASTRTLRELANTNVGGHQVYLIYNYGCIESCSLKLDFYECNFIEAWCPKSRQLRIDYNDESEVDLLATNIEAVSLGYDTTNKTIDVLFHGQKRLSFNYP